MDKNYNPYDNMLAVLEQAAKMMDLNENDYISLKYPERELKVSIPVEMDDGNIKVFEGSGYSTQVQEDLARVVLGITRMLILTKQKH